METDGEPAADWSPTTQTEDSGEKGAETSNLRNDYGAGCVRAQGSLNLTLTILL
jgi:hypothetical protein